jgi:protein TonB
MAFEAILALPDAKPRRWRRGTLAASLVLHLGALAVGLVHSLWQVDEMALPAIQVTLTEAPPPPPPPPPPAGAKKPSTKPKTKIATKTELVQPKETPKEEPKPEEHDEAEDNGQAGGEKGGVVGGVVGGVLGAPPPPPPKSTGPEMISDSEGYHQMVSDPRVPPYCCVKIPRALEHFDSFVATLRVCVGTDGQVRDVRILSGAGPAIDSQIPTYVRRWRYRPLVRGGQPTDFCYQTKYEISMR